MALAKAPAAIMHSAARLDGSVGGDVWMRDSLQSLVQSGCEPNGVSVAVGINCADLPDSAQPRTSFVQGLEHRQGTRDFEASAVRAKYGQGAIEHRDSRCDCRGNVQLSSLQGNLRDVGCDPYS